MSLKQTAISISITTLFIICIATFIAWDQFSYANRPAGISETTKEFHIKTGQTFTRVSKDLYQKKLINNRIMFKIYSHITGKDKSIKAGEYLLSPAMTPKQILEIITIGKTRLHRITIPEGYNLEQIADVVKKSQITTDINFLRLAKDKTIAKEMGIEADTLEGYLFPETYSFPKGITSKKIISTMIKRYKAVFSEKWKKRAAESGFTVHQIMTLASIIEKETADPSERPLISSVFHNRLKKNMRLETDPTVIYGIKNFNGNITRKNLRQYTPYNTYVIKGLPPGPIASPGKESIEAALYPAETKFIFFVSKKNKTHQFSVNLKDHNRAVRRYQLRK